MSKRTVRKPEWVVVVSNEKYRALLAVARAAKRLNDNMRSKDWPEHLDFSRAVARLDKVSK